MRHRAIAFVAVSALALAAVGCSDSNDETTTEDSARSAAEADAGEGSGPITVRVTVDRHTEDFTTSSFAYYPSAITVHPGDTIEFATEFTGNDHTVSAGTMLDEANAIFEELGEEGEPDEAQAAVLDAVPATFDEEVTAAEFAAGANPFVQAGMQPCYATEEAEVSSVEPCPNQEQPATFTGEDLVYSSGFLEDEDVVDVTLDEALPAGDYLFFCLIHGPEMSTTVTVVDAAEPADTPAEVLERAEEEEQAAIEQVREFAESTLENTDPANAFAGPDPALFDQEDTGPMEPDVFPTELTIAAGESVTWTFTGFHTISFNSSESARPAFGYDDEGTVSVKPEASAPAGGAPSMIEIEPPEGASEDGPPPFVPVDGGTFDGSGFFSSGFPPFSDAIAQWTLVFSTPGTYPYLCLIHPDMEGVVNVT